MNSQTIIQPSEFKSLVTDKDNVYNLVSKIQSNLSSNSQNQQKNIPNIQKRRSSYLEQQGQNIIYPTTNNQEQNQAKFKDKSFRYSLGIFINSRVFNFLIIIIVIIFTMLIFIQFAFTNQQASDSQVVLTLYICSWIEFSTLIFFLLEIVLKVYVIGLVNYFDDLWKVFDCFIIISSIVINLLNNEVSSNSFQTVSKIVSTLLRFLRLFLVFRKANQVKKINSIGSRYNVRSPVEKVIEIINSIIPSYDDEIKKDLQWTLSQITSNTLYNPMIDDKVQNGTDWVELGQQKKLNFKKQIDTDIQQDNQLTSVRNQERKQSKIQDTQQAQLLPIDVSELFKQNILKLEFDQFSFYEQYNDLILPYLLNYFFQIYGIYQQLNIKPITLNSFIRKLAQGYHDNPYHNVIHAFDVTQTVNFFVDVCQFQQIADMSSLDHCILLIGAAAHDYGHPGTNNSFQVLTNSEISLQYNDKSPLENYHVSQTFQLLRQEEFNIVRTFKPQEFKYFRERMISMILNTDMVNHFTEISKLKGRLASPEFNPKDTDKPICMDLLLHAADISNPFKPFNIYEKWTYRVLEEFWNQGDIERKQGLGISYLCDRYTTNTAKSQIGFIDFVVFPLYDSLKEFLPIIKSYINQFEQNKMIWKNRIEEFDQILKILNQNKQQEVVSVI